MHQTLRRTASWTWQYQTDFINTLRQYSGNITSIVCVQDNAALKLTVCLDILPFTKSIFSRKKYHIALI